MKIIILAIAVISISIIPVSKLESPVIKLAGLKSIPVDDEGPIKPPPAGKRDRKKPVCVMGICIG